MLRSIRRIRADAPGFLAQCHRAYGDVVAFPVPRTPVVSVAHPDDVRRVLQEHHTGYDKATVQYRTLAAVTGDGLLTSDGALWRRQRRRLQPAFHPRTLEGVAARSAEAAARLAGAWAALPEGSVVDVDDAMMRTTLDVVGTALFGTDLTGDAGRIVSAVLAALDVVVARARTPVVAPAWVPTPGNVRLRRSLATLDATVGRLVAARRARAGEDRPGDVLDLLLAASGDEQPMEPGLLRDEVVTLVVAGHETVASALTWAWHLLADHPDVADRLREETGAVLGAGREARLPTYDDLPRLPWARAVLEETLRLYPPAWVVSRRMLAPDVLGGHALPAGTLVLASPWVVHRHPGTWPDAERFDPSRFLPERRGDVPRHGYLPFGAGPRLCIGREFALVEGTVLLAALAGRVRLERDPGRGVATPPPRVEALVTLRPHGGLPLRLRHR